MDINKILYQGQPLIDLTNTTATASDVKQGKVFHTASGSTATGSLEVPDLSQTTATANDVAIGKKFYDSLGVLTDGLLSGGLEYEEGTITPEEDNSKIDIPFNKEHNEEPLLAWVCDTNGEAPTNSGVSFCVLNYTKIFGGFPSGAYTRQGLAVYLYRGTGKYVDRTVEEIAYNDDRETSEVFVKYFINKTRFKIYTRSSNRYWRAGRTYKWIAIWK